MAKALSEERLGEALPRLLDEAEMSSRALGRSVGVAQSHISRVMNGHLPASAELIERVAAELDLSPEYFADYRELRVIEAIRADSVLRDRVFRGLGRSGQARKSR